MLLAKIVSPEFNKAFQNLMQAKGLPVRTAYKLATIGRIFKAEVEKFEEARRSIVAAYADKDEQGNIKTEKVGNDTIAKIPVENIPVVNGKLSELAKVEVEVNSLSLSDLGESITMTPEDMFHLEFIVE